MSKSDKTRASTDGRVHADLDKYSYACSVCGWEDTIWVLTPGRVPPTVDCGCGQPCTPVVVGLCAGKEGLSDEGD